MSTSAAHASAFCTEAVRNGSVWAVRDEAGFPAPRNGSGQRAQPFWSLRSRAERVVRHVQAYSGLDVVQISLSDFRTRWLPGLDKDDIRVGLNWSGSRATGYDLRGDEVEANLAAVVAQRQRED